MTVQDGHHELVEDDHRCSARFHPESVTEMRNDKGMPNIEHSADISWHFAHSAAQAKYEHIGTAAVAAAKNSLLDTLGVCLAGSGLEPAARGAIELVRESGGRPEASVLGFGGRVPAIMAAFANGTLAHVLDYDDLTPWGQHAGSSVIPAVLAIAERRGNVSGRDLITALAVGQDIFARLRRNVVWRKDWNPGPVLGVFAAAAGASRILEMPAAQIQNALGIATQESSGLAEVVGGLGGDFRGMYAGFSAKGAVLSTLLAEKGVTCVDTPFEGTHGVFNNYFPGGYDRESIVAGIGEDYQGGTTLYKRWPAVGTSHSHAQAMVRIMTEQDLRIEDIREIRTYVGDYHKLMCTPLDARRAPQTLIDARFSLPFIVAVATVRRGLSIWDFTDEGLRDPVVLDVAQRVVPIEDHDLDWKHELPHGRVEVLTHDGRSFTEIGTQVPGSADAPMMWDDLVKKFRECAPAAACRPSQDQVDTLVSTIHELESVENASELLRILD
jgi:2-methylcitrate dehydratase PrpD